MAVEDPRSMLDRLTRLERSNRRWKRGTVLAVCVAILVVGAFAGSPTVAQGPRTVSAQRFVLLSPSGKGTGATLEFSSRGPEVVLYDPGDRPRLRLGIDQHGPGVDASGSSTGSPASCSTTRVCGFGRSFSIADNRPSIVLLDENKRPVFQAP